MAFEKAPTTHPAHCEGRTVVAFSVDGSQIFTAGCDNLVRRFEASPEARANEALTVDLHSSPITSLAVTEDYVFTGSEDMTVGKIDVVSLKPLGAVVRGSQKVFGLAQTVSKKLGACVVCILTGGVSVKLTDVDTGGGKLLTGLPHPAISAAFDSEGGALVALTTHGSLVRFDLTGASTAPVLVKHAVARSSHLQEPCEIAMHPTGRYLSVPSVRPGQVRIMDPITLEDIRALPFGHSRWVSLVRWSPNGQFLATCGPDQCLTVWKVNTWSKCLVLSTSAAITSMAWSPRHNTLALATDQGSLMVYDDLLSSAHGVGKRDWAAVADLDLLSEADGIDDLLRRDAESVEESREPSMEPSGEDLPLEAAPVTLQASFTPGSTQMETSDWQFLAYNAVGGILAQSEVTKPLYSVKFHDRGRYADYQFSDLRRYTLASLSTHGALFAMQDYLFYRPHADPDPRSAWEAALPSGEEVVAAAATPRGPVVCTSRGHARFFTCLGLQYRVATLPSPTLLSLASDQGDRLLYVYHRGAEPTNLRLGYSLVDLASMRLLGSGALTLSPGSALEWIGFSQDGIPACSDSEGLVQVLADPQAAAWGQVYCLRIASDPSWIEHPLIRPIPWHASPAITRHNCREEADLLLARLETRLEPENPERRHLIEDRLLLSLLNHACKADLPKQAVELATMLNRLESFTFAEKIAASHHLEDALDRIQQIRAVKASFTGARDAEAVMEPPNPPAQETSPVPSPERQSPALASSRNPPKDLGSNPFVVPVKHGSRAEDARPIKRFNGDRDEGDPLTLKTPRLRTPRAALLASPNVAKTLGGSPAASATTPVAKRKGSKAVCHLPISEDSD
ncbi:DNA polymerase alpha accessory factor Mcl1 [Massospora cicadina]|nr:DNA polymerase alpha accessory factor Mcl1 [Massospora cicadina]